MAEPVPQPIAPKTSTQNNEVAIATSFSDVQRFFQPLTVKVSKNSPPTANDTKEMQWTFDKTALRLYIQVDGVSRYVQFT
jgi:hypothetical protein